MINPENFYTLLKKNGIDFFTGVPGSLLKSICAYITDNVPIEKNIISANEGGAISLGSVYHLATGGIPLIYMQNSGIGNTISVETKDEIINGLQIFNHLEYPSMLEIKVNKGARKNLGRPSSSPIENKEVFMDYIKK